MNEALTSFEGLTALDLVCNADTGDSLESEQLNQGT